MKLRKKDLLGASDSYAKLKLTESKLPSKKIAVKHKNLNPKWNEEFTMVIKDPESQALVLNVYDREQVGKHEKMGKNAVPVKELTTDEPRVMLLPLLKTMDPNDVQNEKECGQIVMELTHNLSRRKICQKTFKNLVKYRRLREKHLLVEVCWWSYSMKLKVLRESTIPILMRHYFKGEERKIKHIKKQRSKKRNSCSH